MSKNLVDGNSFEFVEGTEKTEYEDLINGITYDPNATGPSPSEQIKTTGYVDGNDHILFILPLSRAVVYPNVVNVISAQIKVMQGGQYYVGSANAYENVTNEIRISYGALCMNISIPWDFTSSGITKLDPVAIDFDLTFDVVTP